MPLVPMAPPVSVPMSGGFDYVTVDAVHHRVYAAHSGAKSLLIVNSENGSVVGQVTVGPMHGVAVDPANGHVYTGNGDDKTVSEVDPVAMKVLRTTATVSGPIDAIAYDPSNGHIYADEDDGTHVYVVDAKTMKVIKSITIPGHKPEYLAVDPVTHALYQNIADLAEVSTIDPTSLAVTSTFKTPELTNNHPLQYDEKFHEIVTGGANGVMSVYTTDGKKKFETTIGKRFDQCTLDQGTHVMACAGSGGVTAIQLSADAAPKIIATVAVDPGVHTVGIDPATHVMWAVWSTEKPGAAGAAYVQGFSLKP